MVLNKVSSGLQQFNPSFQLISQVFSGSIFSTPSSPAVTSDPLAQSPLLGPILNQVKNQQAPKAQTQLNFVESTAPQIVTPSQTSATASSQRLNLPARPANALSGSAFFEKVKTMDRMQREEAIKQEILSGNIPDHLRNLQTIETSYKGKDGVTHTAQIPVTPDYLAIGSQDDYVLVPMSPITAQAIADASGSHLPTRKLVDQIYKQAAVKLSPRPQPPGSQMMSTPYYAQHNATVSGQRAKANAQPGQLLAGHKKDVVITNRLNSKPGSVAIYGWHQPDGKAIQPLSTIHENTYADYSHGARLISGSILVDGQPRALAEVLKDPNLAPLLSDEGVIGNPRATRP